MNPIDLLQGLAVALGLAQPVFAVTAVALCAVLSACLFYFAYGRVQADDRTYKDPLPPGLRLLWPLIALVAHFFCSQFPIGLLEAIERRLTRTGVSFLLSAEQFIALTLISALGAASGTWFCLAVLDKQQPVFLLMAVALGLFLPSAWLNDTRMRRELAVIRSMPLYLDFLTMCVEAGLNFSGALAQAVEKAPEGPLRTEFATVLRDLRAGVPRAQALRRMSDRLDILEVTSFVSAVVQAERMGASLASVLRVQAEQRREERFQRAEKMAMEAPVKLIAPLIMFIFPVTFIVLGFPIAMKFLEQGTF